MKLRGEFNTYYYYSSVKRFCLVQNLKIRVYSKYYFICFV
jgi:hypothetical protein